MFRLTWHGVPAYFGQKHLYISYGLISCRSTLETTTNSHDARRQGTAMTTDMPSSMRSSKACGIPLGKFYENFPPDNAGRKARYTDRD
jgi:hypothetical protein